MTTTIMKTSFAGLLLGLLLLAGSVGAQTDADPLQAFRQSITVGEVSVVVPTVLDVLLPVGTLERPTVLVEESGNEDTRFIGSILKTENTDLYAPVTVSSADQRLPSLSDDDFDTSETFAWTEEGSNEVTLLLESRPVTASGLIVSLSRNVTLPTTVEISALVNGVKQVVVARTKMNSNRIRFPELTAEAWEVTFSYAQPLQISEVRLVQDEVESQVTRNVRFLAQPDRSYKVYFDADRSVVVSTTETGSLAAVEDEEVYAFEAYEVEKNKRYQPADVDEDGIRDEIDNCVAIANPDQLDRNDNGQGDSCEDFDRDGVSNHTDNCPDQPNRRQADEDGDGIGDVCDEAESRLTEQYAWIPWVGMGIAALVLLVMFIVVAKRPEEDEVNSDEVVSDGEDVVIANETEEIKRTDV